MALDIDDLVAVQAALEEAQLSLEDLELSWELQKQEFFGSGDDASSVASTPGDDSLGAMKQAMEEQVQQLTERLQQLKDAQLARELHQQLLAEAARLTSDSRLAASIGDREDEGPSGRDVEALAAALQQRSGGERIQLVLTFEADMKASQPGLAGCGALLMSPAGEVLWEGSRLVQSSSLPQARLAAAVQGLQAAVGLGLGGSGTLVLQSSAPGVLDELMGGDRAQSSAMGPLSEEARELLGSFARWHARRAPAGAMARAAQLAREGIGALQEQRAPPAQQLAGTGSTAQGGTGASAAGPPAGGREPCQICLEEVPVANVHVIGGCLHRFCAPCLRMHTQAVIRARTYPVACPHPGCGEAITPAECELLLAASAGDVAMYRQVEAEASIPEQARFYCPNPRCSAPLHLEDEPVPDAPQFCPSCAHKICVHCRVIWHKGFGCSEYQALPSAQRQPEDLALLRTAQRHRWRQCTQCKHMIELGEGCRHMTCKCGYEFCYACGKPWTKVPGQRSTSTCTCELFDTAPARDEPGGAAPAAAAEAAVLNAILPHGVPPWVPPHIHSQYKTVLCMYHSEGNCARGERCWFAHGDNDLRQYRRGGSVPRWMAQGSDEDSD